MKSFLFTNKCNRYIRIPVHLAQISFSERSPPSYLKYKTNHLNDETYKQHSTAKKDKLSEKTRNSRQNFTRTRHISELAKNILTKFHVCS